MCGCGGDGWRQLAAVGEGGKGGGRRRGEYLSMSIVEDFFLVRPCALLLQPHSAAAATSALPLLPPLRCHCRRRAVLPLPPPLHFADRLLRFEARATPPGDITCLPTRPLNRGGQHDAF